MQMEKGWLPSAYFLFALFLFEIHREWRWFIQLLEFSDWPCTRSIVWSQRSSSLHFSFPWVSRDPYSSINRSFSLSGSMQCRTVLAKTQQPPQNRSLKNVNYVNMCIFRKTRLCDCKWFSSFELILLEVSSSSFHGIRKILGEQVGSIDDGAGRETFSFMVFL